MAVKLVDVRAPWLIAQFRIARGYSCIIRYVPSALTLPLALRAAWNQSCVSGRTQAP